MRIDDDGDAADLPEGAQVSFWLLSDGGAARTVDVGGVRYGFDSDAQDLRNRVLVDAGDEPVTAREVDHDEWLAARAAHVVAVSAARAAAEVAANADHTTRQARKAAVLKKLGITAADLDALLWDR